MKRFIQGEDRTQSTLLPELLDEYIAEANPVRVVDVYVDELDLGTLGFEGVDPAATGRPAYHPAVLLKIYIYGYLNRIQSSRRLEREAQRNVELMWLTGRLTPDFKTIANFRKDNGKAIRGVCKQFVVLCQQLGLFSEAVVAIDGSKFNPGVFPPARIAPHVVSGSLPPLPMIWRCTSHSGTAWGMNVKRARSPALRCTSKTFGTA
jgi:transposase